MTLRFWISMLFFSLLYCGTLAAGETIRFRRGGDFTVNDLPDTELRRKILTLPAVEQARALANLKSISFDSREAKRMRAGNAGDIYFLCGENTPEARAFRRARAGGAETVGARDIILAAPVPVTAPPVYHSRPAATRKIFLDFNGHVVTGTQWNIDYGVTTYNTLPMDIDGNNTTFNDAEQLLIKRIWMRVSEDFAPFDVDVTTEEPATFTNQTARVLITPSKSQGGVDNPDVAEAIGIAYLNVYGNANFQTRQPAWVYSDLHSHHDGDLADTISHEFGHNLGLSHDGTSQDEYSPGHGGTIAVNTSWGPIMGAPYDKNLTTWTRGEYFDASNTEDDLTIITGKMPYRVDDHGNTNGTATQLSVVDAVITSTNLDSDPTNSSPLNKGVIETNTDIDVFRFDTGGGPVVLNISVLSIGVNARGNNLDLRADVYNSVGTIVATANVDDQCDANIAFNAISGVYFLQIQGVGVGTPLAATPTGYTDYGSLGYYFINGSLQDVDPDQELPNAVMPVNPKLTTPGAQALGLQVSYFDELAIDVASIDSFDIRVTGPNNYSALATLVSVNNTTNGTPRIANYTIPPPGGTWDPSDNGFYDVTLLANQIANTSGRFAPSKFLGTITIAIDGGVPTTVADSATTGEGQPVTVNVLANDVGNDPRYVVVILTPPQHGTAVVNSDRTITYTPVPGYSGPDSLTYASTDFQVQSGSATLSLTVNPAPPLITSALAASAVQGVQFRYTITTTGTQPQTITAVPLPAGTVLQGTEITGFIQPGSYAVTLSATNAFGTDTRVLVINASQAIPNADADGDGFSDEMEIAFGSDPASQLSTPINTLKDAGGGTGAAAGAPANAQPFSLARSGLSVKLNFVSLKPARDAISLSGSLPMPVSAQVGSQSFAIFVGGAAASGALNEKGLFTGNNTKFKVGNARAGLLVRNSPFTAQIKGIYAASLADEGLLNANLSKVLCKVPVYVLIGPQYFKADATVSYSSKKDKTGTAKSAK